MEEQFFEPKYPAQDYTKRPNPTALLSPLYDWTFKAMFTQETEESNLALKSFISAVLGRTITKVILKSTQPPKESHNQRSITFDVCAEFDDGEVSEIEMQSWQQGYYYPSRAEIQAARLLSNNVRKGKNWEGPKVYQISVLNFHYKKDDNRELSWYTMKDVSGKTLADKLNIIFIDLVTIRQKFGTPIEKLTSIEKWGLFLSYIDDLGKAQYIEDLIRSEKGIMAAGKTVKKISKSDDNWYYQNSIFIAECDRNTIQANLKKKAIEEGRAQGRAQGLAEGIQQKTIEDARSFYANGASLELISKSLKIPIAEVKEIVGITSSAQQLSGV